jgi:hypothetical protein
LDDIGRVPWGIFENPNSLDATIIGEICHIAVASSDTSTTLGSPVRSRFSSAAAMAPAVASPPITSPNPGVGCAGGQPPSRSGIVAPMPPRAQNAAPS